MSTPEKKLAELNKEAALLGKLMAKFPDLQINHGRWNIKRYYSKSVNPIADKIHYRHSCGCCEDAAYYADPYIDFEGTYVYADPVGMYIGDKCSYEEKGYRFYKDWEQSFTKAGINPKLIEELRNYIEPPDEIVSYQNYDTENDYEPINPEYTI